MHPTRNDLPENARRAVTALLQARLVDAIDLSLQAKQAHWNVKGPAFIALHELFDKVHAQAAGQVDELAERIAMLGGAPDGRAATVAAKSGLPSYPLDVTAGPAHVTALANALAAYGKAVRAAIDEATRLGDAGTADLFTGISRDADQQLWFVEAHLQAER